MQYVLLWRPFENRGIKVQFAFLQELKQMLIKVFKEISSTAVNYLKEQKHVSTYSQNSSEEILVTELWWGKQASFICCQSTEVQYSETINRERFNNANNAYRKLYLGLFPKLIYLLDMYDCYMYSKKFLYKDKTQQLEEKKISIF